jgi:hypothetical protein
MQTSVFLAKLLGPFFLAAGAGLLFNGMAFRGIADEFLRSPALVFLAGLIVMPAGLAIVLTHNVWALNWPVLITILGWLALLGGMLRLTMPQRATSIGRTLYRHPTFANVSAALWLAAGAYLCFFGYFY